METESERSPLRILKRLTQLSQKFEAEQGLLKIVDFVDANLSSAESLSFIDSYRKIIRSNTWHYEDQVETDYQDFLKRWTTTHEFYLNSATEMFNYLNGNKPGCFLSEVHGLALISETFRGREGKRSLIGLDHLLDNYVQKLTDLIQKVITPTDLEDTVGLFVSTMDEPYLSAENELFLDFYKYSQQVDGELTRIINEYKDLKSVQQGEILVTAQTDMNYTPYLQQCAGLITESGGRYSHAAIYARENNLPCITGVENARKLFSEGLALTLDADRNEIYQDLK